MVRSALIVVVAAVCVATAACQSARSGGDARPAAVAAGGDEVAFGRRVAGRLCAECHALDPGQASPLADAPPFPTLYARFPVEQLGGRLEAGMMVGHPRMPLLRELDPDEEVALVAYLSHFRPPTPAHARAGQSG